jgi:CubicO group peptidase (beta-lactamase class C family)
MPGNHMAPRIPALIASLAIAASIAAQPAPRGWDAVVEGYRAALQRSGIAGSSLMLVRDGKIVARQNEGFQDRDRRVPVDDGTIYHWASITKTFTGIAIMQLRDRGLLSLDDPVVKYVPELRLAHDPFGDISQVKIRHLMSHSAGFRASTWPWGGDKPWHPFEPTTWEQLVAMLPYTDVQFEPGSKYSYSNPGVIFLGRIIQLLSGDDYEVYVTKNILMPLAMHNTFFDRAPYHLLPRRSHSYFRDDAGIREARFDFDTGITVSNGGLNAPFDDMAKYLAFLLGDGPPDVVLKRSSLEEMWTRQIRAAEGEGVNGTDSYAGLSFFIERYGDVELVGHSGDQNGFISHLYLYRPSRTAYLVSFNTDTTPSKDGSRPGTRQADAAVRDLVIRNILR